MQTFLFMRLKQSFLLTFVLINFTIYTVRDTDIAEVSSEYIKKQILQQAAATLLATANQTPEIALQLINGTYR